MTEDDAKTKWCPFARLRDDSTRAQGYNRVAGIGFEFEAAICIGSRCMAWRLDAKALDMDMDAKGILFRPAVGEAPHGFCGLAGGK